MIGIQRLFWSKAIQQGVPYSNGSGYSNPEMDRLLEAGQVENDPQKRRQILCPDAEACDDRPSHVRDRLQPLDDDP